MLIFTTMINDVDDRAFMQEVYQQNERLMYAIALKYASNTQDCEDIVHDTVEKLCKNKKLRELLIDFSLEFAQDLLSSNASPETSAFGDIHDGVPSTPEELEEMYPPVKEDKREGGLR